MLRVCIALLAAAAAVSAQTGSGSGTPCQFSVWTATTPCSVTCGTGSVTEERTVVVGDAEDCAQLESLSRTVPCTLEECPPPPQILTDAKSMKLQVCDECTVMAGSKATMCRLDNLCDRLGATKDYLLLAVANESKARGMLADVVAAQGSDIGALTRDAAALAARVATNDGLLVVLRNDVDGKATSGSVTTLAARLDRDIAALQQSRATINDVTLLKNQVTALSSTKADKTALTLKADKTDLDPIKADIKTLFASLNFKGKVATQPFQDCREATTSGIYWVKPGSRVLQAYCDTSNGGGWMLLYSYNHRANENHVLSFTDQAPLSPTHAYSHTTTHRLGMASSWTKRVRFYCQTSAHSRRIHFSTAQGAVVSGAFTYKGAGANGFRSGFTRLSGHSGFVPGSRVTGGFTGVADGFHNFPFYRGGAYHWGIRGQNHRWECDDYPNGPRRATVHNVYVRNF